MSTRVDAIYEGGVLRPVTPLALMEHERVTITVEPSDDDMDHEYIARCRAELAGLDRLPTLEETQELLRGVPGSFADAIIRARGDR
jgi:predicted DNA-binding antitoxin AbrB/MazE fold protein